MDGLEAILKQSAGPSIATSHPCKLLLYM